jgi:hypothetical protein
MHGGLATANQVRDQEKELKQKILQMESAIKIFIYPISTTSAAPDNSDVQVQRKYTSFMCQTNTVGLTTFCFYIRELSEWSKKY